MRTSATTTATKKRGRDYIDRGRPNILTRLRAVGLAVSWQRLGDQVVPMVFVAQTQPERVSGP